jgi:membrane-associated protease RseP (regulator of RpoE activity)
MESPYNNQTWTHHPAETGNSVSSVDYQPPIKKRNYTALFLFLLTVFSTVWAGSIHRGVNIFTEPLMFYKGLPFAFTLLLILGIHESGHYFTCKVHNIPATVPYFIPMPNILGTMGAFIRIKGVISNRRVLLDIGMAGPLAGFVIALPATIIGYRLSGIEQAPTGEGLMLGRSILTWILEMLFIQTLPSGYSIALHPIGFAGYIGLFVTAMNLLPVGQLDGSHIVSALLGQKQHVIARVTVVLLLLFGVFWPGWWLWAFLLLMTGMKHQIIRHDAHVLGPKRRVLAWLTMFILIITFVPIPFSFGTFTP